MNTITITLTETSEGLLAVASQTDMGSQYDSRQVTLLFERPDFFDDHALLVIFSSSFGRQVFTPLAVHNNQFVVTSLFTQGERLSMQVLMEKDGQQVRSNQIEFVLRPSIASFKPPQIDLPDTSTGSVKEEVVAADGTTSAIRNAGDSITLDVTSADETEGKAILKLTANSLTLNDAQISTVAGVQALLSAMTVSGVLAASVVNLIYPVGSIYTSFSNVNPGLIFAGTIWEAFGPGRSIVCVNTMDPDFSEAGKIGGEKDKLITPRHMPVHEHTYAGVDSITLMLDAGATEVTLATPSAASKATSTSGQGETHSNMAPYITAYHWRRMS